MSFVYKCVFLDKPKDETVAELPGARLVALNCHITDLNLDNQR